MTRDFANRPCAGAPGATRSDRRDGGHDARELGGKMFARVGVKGEGRSITCPDMLTAAMLKDAGLAVKAPSFHRARGLLPLDRVEAGETAHRTRVSHDAIRAGPPHKVGATLETPRPAPGAADAQRA